MTNLTIAIDEEVLRRARIRALEQGSSVNAVLREFLLRYVDEGELVVRDRATLRRVVEHATAHSGDSDGQSLAREAVYEERLQWPR